MNILSYHENLQRGTPDFPVEFFSISENHPKYQMQTHWHKDFELIRILEGTFHLTLNETHFSLSKGQSAVIPGGIIHGGKPNNCRYQCLVFSAGILYAAGKCRTLIKAYMQTPIIYDANSDVDYIFDCFEKQSPGFELMVISRLYALAGSIVDSHPETPVMPNEKLEKIKAAISMIEDNYSKKITLDDLASVCRMSPNYFSRFFKEITRQTPFEYIITYRIEAACEMLSGGAENITEVCFSCGFNDLSYFIHIFKKYKGMSPKTYAKLFKQAEQN